ncbi:MAG: hypothetical protein A2X25_01600 [Chloroflexi bacterium GWB2_49_20]|nr:MAG: hypothetical protein A2X25_01600 [Chloroflexi bacterium GWB2_49_20]OGN78146.1 MAG: hypothetical protein A2X26_14205 [Chloroflexi bacterium GWC2_49_37]OGN85182.1 MAG: hypothetical protein A2X27_06860 [Chloroflexi bacterium GWD2_49_16]
MLKKKNPLFVAFVVLFISMACMINVGGPDYPASQIPVSTDELTSMEEQFQAAVSAGTQTGQVTLFITESQLTSFLANKLDSQENPYITQPQAYLQNGQIQIYGTVVKGFLKATASIVLTASIDPDGKLLLELSSADFGPLPVPDSLKEVITTLVTEAYTGSLGPVATGFKVESIVIANGAMMVVGRIK